MVFLTWVHSDSICPFVRVTILMFHHEFSFILTSYPIHQNVHLVLFSKYIQSLTPLTTSTSQEVFSWKLTLGWSQAEARWSGVCSWEYLRKGRKQLGKREGCGWGTVTEKAWADWSSTRSPEPGQPLGAMLNWGEEPGHQTLSLPTRHWTQATPGRPEATG